MLSKIFSPSGITKKPAICSYALGPTPLTFKISFLFLKLPFSFLYSTIFLATVFLIPEICESNAQEAVLILAPTLLTTWLITLSRDSSNLDWFTSCWYIPTPIDLGSIFTSSAKGSCILLPIEIAPLTVTSKSGNSSAAILEAE